MFRVKHYNKGLLSEFVAKVFLLIKGYRIIAQRYKTKFSEIDIIAQKNSTIVFVEIKFRRKFSLEFNPISLSQLTRIRKTAKIFTSRGFYKHNQIRFDLILIEPFKIRHLTNAF